MKLEREDIIELRERAHGEYIIKVKLTFKEKIGLSSLYCTLYYNDTTLEFGISPLQYIIPMRHEITMNYLYAHKKIRKKYLKQINNQEMCNFFAEKTYNYLQILLKYINFKYKCSYEMFDEIGANPY